MASVTRPGSSSNSSRSEPSNNDRRSRVMVGNLPEDFLRPDVDIVQTSSPANNMGAHSQQEMIDRELAIQLQQQQWAQQRHQIIQTNYAGQLTITVVEATFVKNYGMTKMDPYARLRIGHTIYETHACASGGKTPRWNKRIQCYLPSGVKTLGVEIYDECALTMDELIGYGQITIPEVVFCGESVDDWFQLSGKQGENKEGSIHLIFTLTPISSTPMMAAPGSMNVAMPPGYAGYSVGGSVIPVGQVPMGAPVVMVPGYPSYAPVTVYNPAAAGPVAAPMPVPSRPPPKPLTDEEIKEIQSMFPSLDHQVVQSVIDACGGRREAIVDSLLQISEQ